MYERVRESDSVQCVHCTDTDTSFMAATRPFIPTKIFSAAWRAQVYNLYFQNPLKNIKIIAILLHSANNILILSAFVFVLIMSGSQCHRIFVVNLKSTATNC